CVSSIFFQAEDGIRDFHVTGVQTCALPISVNTPPWIAAPNATTSSGLTPFEGSFPKNFLTASWIAGIRVEPPTRITSSISEVLRSEERRVGKEWRFRRSAYL